MKKHTKLRHLFLSLIFSVPWFTGLMASNQEMTSALRLPNAYIIKPGEKVSIPVIKAFAVWSQITELASTNPNLSGSLSATLLWQDTPDLIKDISIQGADKQATIQIESNNTSEGNATVALKIGNKIRWSWHIWVTSYNPDTEYSTLNTFIFMNRNLGSFTKTGSLNTTGLLYQFGRKDPFPEAGDNSQSNYHYTGKKIYNKNNAPLSEGTPNGGTGKNSKPTTQTQNLPEAIINPMTFYMGTSDNAFDWYSATPSVHNDTLWGGGKWTKGVFDPSPHGWRVPTAEEVNTLYNDLLQEPDNYPLSGSRDYTNGSFYMTGQYGMYWSATPSQSWGTYMFISNELKSAGCSQYRANGYAIRCIKDTETPSATESMEWENILAYANNGKIYIKGLRDKLFGQNLILYNTQGQTIEKIKIASHEEEIGQSLPTGIYLVHITGYNYALKVSVN